VRQVLQGLYDVMETCACAEELLVGVRRPTLKPASRELGREPLFGLDPLRLFNRQIGGHLIDPGRHPVSQSPLDREIGRVARLARGEFGCLLFHPMLGCRELRLKCFDMGFECSDDLIGQRPLIRIPGTLDAAIDPSDIVPAIRWPNSRSLVVSEGLLPKATLRPLANRLGRHAQQFGGLPVGKPLARQNRPRRLDVGPRRQPAAQRGL
jgi:hypothetical protein